MQLPAIARQRPRRGECSVYGLRDLRCVQGNTAESFFGHRQPPRLQRDRAERQAGAADAAAFQIKRRCRRHQRVFVRLAFAHLDVGRGRGRRRNFDRGDDLTLAQLGFARRIGTGQAVEVGDRHASLAGRAAQHQHGIQCGQRDRRVGRVNGDAGIAPAEDRALLVEAFLG